MANGRLEDGLGSMTAVGERINYYNSILREYVDRLVSYFVTFFTSQVQPWRHALYPSTCALERKTCRDQAKLATGIGENSRT